MPSFRQICDAIKVPMTTIASIRRVNCYYELTEGMNTLPTLEIYPERWNTDTATETDRTTACAPNMLRQTNVVVYLDLYARQRSQIAEDWNQAVEVADDIQDKLEEQCACPIFGLAGVRSFQWEAQRVVFERDWTPPPQYAGFRFILTLRIF